MDREKEKKRDRDREREKHKPSSTVFLDNVLIVTVKEVPYLYTSKQYKAIQRFKFNANERRRNLFKKFRSYNFKGLFDVLLFLFFFIYTYSSFFLAILAHSVSLSLSLSHYDSLFFFYLYYFGSNFSF